MGAVLFICSSVLILLLFSQFACSCSIDWFYCEKQENANAGIRACGHEQIKCRNSSLYIQFRGKGPWYLVENITFPDKTFSVRDNSLASQLQLSSKDCDFLYSFTTPVRNFLPSDITSLNSGVSFFNCKPNSYNFSADIFQKSYHSSYCRGYELYYSYQSDTIRAPPNCTVKDAMVEWVMLFNDDNSGGINFFLSSVGFSRRRVAQECFGCRMSSGLCSSVAADNSACSCNLECTLDKPLRTRSKILIGVAAPSILCILAICIFCFRKNLRSSLKRKSETFLTVEAFLENNGLFALKRYKYSDVKRITGSFSSKLGQGGYGSVFKGKLHDSSLVAVKVLSETKGSGEDFINEVASIGRTNHVNVVSLLGFCSEGSKRALIYEYMPNGSLERFLFTKDAETATALGWDTLYKITLGIAKGLEYLHRGCKTRIVHFDIKPHNILLDEDFCPKISDFGLAILCPSKESAISMVCARGTIGYIAPEVFSRNFGVVSSKSDVYSYGMMVLEMVGGRKNADARVENSSEIYFPHWIYEHFDQVGSLGVCGITAETKEIAKKMVLVGLWCIQTSPANRPSMGRVREMLEGSAGDLQMPPKPYLCSPPRSNHGSCENAEYPSSMS